MHAVQSLPVVDLDLSRPDPNHLPGEAALVERARTDTQAFADLYRFYLPRIHAFAYRRSGSKEVAEDVSAATFENALKNLHRFEPRGGGFGAWLFRIAANQLNDHHRKTGRARGERGQRAMSHLVGRVEEPDEVALVNESQAIVRDALSKLSTRYQRALSLRYLSGLTNEEAADAFGVSRSTMAVIVHRSLKSLRKHLDGVDIDGFLPMDGDADLDDELTDFEEAEAS
jgi:RNA polymerase sigma-70 factor (ECF subfamily)